MWWCLPITVLLVSLGSCQGAYVVRDTRSVVTPEEAADPSTPAPEKSQVTPSIRSLHVTSDVKYRYATTLVSTRVVNPANQSGEATFTVTLPESAFISDFLMEIKDKVYKAYVKEKEEAKAIYEQAVNSGQFAGHVAQDARDSNQFTVSVNIEAHGKVTFNLTYEQLLTRNLGLYSNVISINPQQIVEDMSVTVNIEEPTAIVDLEVPDLQLSNEAIPEKQNEYAKIEEKSPNHKIVIWAPTPEEQKSKNSTGLNGQFIVKYDVDRAANPQQILVDEGYFVHFFAPDNLPKLRKHVVFVLDFSGSMGGQKLDQLKEAMKQIFSDLNPKDYFSIVIFQSWVEVWSPSKVLITSLPSYMGVYDKERLAARIEKIDYNGTVDSKYVVEASPANIELARSFMANYSDLGSTNIIGGLRTGLQLTSIGEEHWANDSDPPQPVMVFLTDGQPNEEEYRTDVIINKTKELNTKHCPIFSLGFGYGADYDFLRKLSLQNDGFARNIYEAADATQQLKKFYATISSPLLSNVTFTYLPGQVDNSTHTKEVFPVFYKGSELVVAGRVNKENIAAKKTICEVRGISASGLQTYPIVIDHIINMPQNISTGHLEKAWSYLNIQQLLDKIDSLDNGEEKNQTKKKALDLALQYGFVTPLTSLVVVKPNETESSAVDATKIKPGLAGPQFAAFPVSSPGIAGAGGFGGGFPGAVPLARPMAPAFYNPSSTPFYQSLQTVSASGPGHASSSSSGNTYESSAPAMEMQTEVLSVDTTEISLQGPNKISLQDVKWVKGAMNTTNSDIIVKIEGSDYKVGLNETNSVFGDCQVNSLFGECRHLQFCALDIFQDDISQYLPYKCPIPGEYLGVCCPKNQNINFDTINSKTGLAEKPMYGN